MAKKKVLKRKAPKRVPEPEVRRRFEQYSIMDIDRNMLEHECEMQPKLFLYYSDHLDEAWRVFNAAKSKLKLVEAEMDQCIRANPEKYKLDSTSNEKVAQAIIRSSEYKIAEFKMRKAQDKLNTLSTIVEALRMRKDSIGYLCKLEGQGYYSQVKVTPQARAAFEHRTRKLFDHEVPKR